MADWLREFGPRMVGERLWKALGFKSRRSYERAVQLGRLEIRLYPFTQGRGRFARTDEVARHVWKEVADRKAGKAVKEPANPGATRTSCR
ncbi:MAG TPA: hypothetical protein VGR71_10850 [Nitrospira sp.]|nr:hypothetical protein [Nitrospira sp.]